MSEFGIAIPGWVGDLSGKAGIVAPFWLGDFAGKSNIVISLSDETVAHSNATSALARYTLKNDGQVTKTQGGNTFFVENWCNVAAAVGDYDVHASVLPGGANPTGSALNSWLNLASSQSWTLQQGTNGIKTCSLFVQIRKASSGTVLDSAMITMEADNI